MEKEEIKKEAVKIIRKYLPEEYKILLFGSWAKGDALKTSDLDIGILGKKEVAWELMHKILEEMEEIQTLRSIDVVDLKSTGKNYANKILEYAKPLA
ncbi:nucleotidyltransferase domain-containing protein [Patescibacteria group bacterium]|nr:nucleotidyltransferase domain-containing protein [Patescibacteria group bacterium]